MGVFIARRLLAVPPLLLAVSFITFLLLDAAPGDYVTRLAEDPHISAETLAELRHRYGLDGSLVERYGRWLLNAVQGDFGYSFSKEIGVFTLIGERLGNTLLLSGSALLLAWGMALPLGVVAGVRQGSVLDKVVSFISFFGLSIPRVFFALLMVMFAATTKWFPVGGMRDLVEWDTFTPWQKVVDVAHHLVLPTIVLGTTQMAAYMRQMRAEMVETLGKDFVRTARAKGLSTRQVVWKHAFGNAVNPLITLFGYSLAALLTGSFLVEVVFAWPGLARLTVDAVFSQDEPVVMASVVMATVMLVVGNLIADILLGAVDPRIGVG
ncbi:MAG: ABC transporter permease [Myxococcales bacterium]|nr:ABC transporter permease [Myxococcales bacterium]MCB9548746.1 ABC transporter permease [Myxococcales bacterium]